MIINSPDKRNLLPNINIFNCILISILISSTFLSPVLVHAADIDTEININKQFAFKDIEFNLRSLIDGQGISFPEFWLETDIINNSHLLAGRKVLNQGPGHFSQLMLSAEGPPLDFIMLKKSYKYFDAEQMVAFLGEGVEKQLFVHRLENSTFIPHMTIGISEAMMASEKIHPAYYLPLPYWPYYLTAKLLDIDSEYNLHEDKYIGMDFIYTFSGGTEIYGELLVDEFPQKEVYGQPHKTAHLIGAYYPYNQTTSFRMEYSNVFKGVYLHRYPQNNYIHDDHFIGHWLGPDADQFDLEVSKKLGDKNEVTLGYRNIRRGSGNDVRDLAETDNQEGFLTEIVEENKLLRLGYKREIDENKSFKVNIETGQSRQNDLTSDIFNISLVLNLNI